MSEKIIIYESAMCCSSGLCGPSPDQGLLDLQNVLEEIKKMGSEVERYSITLNPKKFRENPQVLKLIQEQQLKALPITTLNGNVVKSGGYPTLKELKQLLKKGVVPSPVLAQEMASEQDCCTGQNFCDIRCAPSYKGGAHSDADGNCCQ
ncbi:MAG: arsenite efflux transporter metallochaperone ArsD [Dehalococcoidia bacterium]|nr:arsenite efflux transporter metallochaperone ArsD [Dehalococcoidia bacterium]